LLGTPELVPDVLRDDLARPEHELLVSAVSSMEVATKVLPQEARACTAPRRHVVGAGAGSTGPRAVHRHRARARGWGLDSAHHDPFDRLLVAQGLVENVTLVTSDAAISGIPACE
jgi:PIN domain nuclease of toxin-antitoxin system